MIKNYTRILRDNHTVDPYIVVLTKNVDPRTVQDRLTLKCTATEGALPDPLPSVTCCALDSQHDAIELLVDACHLPGGVLRNRLCIDQAVAGGLLVSLTLAADGNDCPCRLRLSYGICLSSCRCTEINALLWYMLLN
jgi:hypothetical protein